MSSSTAAAGLDSATVEASLDEVAGHLNAQHGRLIELTVWLLEHPGEWQGDGVWTPVQYLAWRCAISPATARKIVEAAERASELPVTVELVRRGELSLDQLLPIVRTVPAWGDEQVASLAPRLTVPQVQRVVRETDWDWKPGVAPAPAPAPEHDAEAEATTPANPGDAGDAVSHAAPEPENRVSWGTTPDGRWWLRADLDIDLGKQVEASIDEARDALFRDLNQNRNHNDDAGVITAASDADALVAMANRSLEAVESVARRDRHRVNWYCDPTADLRTTDHVGVPDSIARLLTCDGRIDPVFVDGATPVSVGRSQRTIPDRLRRHVLYRDAHRCQVPGCTATRGLDLHHIIHWRDDGPTDTWNLVTICSRHHRMHHKGRLGITGNADEPSSLRFTNASGVEIRRSGASPAPPAGRPPHIDGRYRHPLGERLDGRWVTFVNPATPPLERRRTPGLTG